MIKLNALGKTLQRFDESLQYDESQPPVIDASIQRFEFCIELTWKTLKACLAQARHYRQWSPESVYSKLTRPTGLMMRRLGSVC